MKHALPAGYYYCFNTISSCITALCLTLCSLPYASAQTTYNATWSSIVLSDNRENAYCTYTLTATNPSSSGGSTSNSYIPAGGAVQIIFPAGDVTTFTGGAFNGAAISGWSFTGSTQINFNAPVAVAKGAVFTVVLNNISNPSFMGAPCASPNQYPYSCGFMCCTTGDIRMLAANATGANNIFSGGLYTIAQATKYFKSLTTVTASTLNALQGTNENEIIYIIAEIGGSLGSISASSFSLNTTGCTNPSSDITAAYLWYTGTTPCFHAPGDQQVGAAITSPSGAMNFVAPVPLSQGKNYFWLVYDIPCSAAMGNTLDGQCTSVTIGGTPYVPTVTSPSGNRIITQNILSNPVNYVPNYGFETYSSCPTSFTNSITNHIVRATPWDCLSWPSAGTSDFFNACNGGCPNLGAGTPCNFFGYQPPKAGNGYAGFGYPAKSGGSYEYIQAPLTTPLTAGTTYAFTMYVVLANSYPTFTDGWGVYLSASQVTASNWNVLPVTPQVMANSIIQDSINWELISGTFVASGGESWITVGNFKNAASLQVNGTGGAYYYVDEIRLGLLSTVDPCVTLPLQLLSFEGVNRGKYNLITWEEANQIPEAYFTLEKSADAVSWEQSGSVKSATASGRYKFTDSLPFNPVTYYRLKSTGPDAQYENSGIITVEKTFGSNLEIRDWVFFGSSLQFDFNLPETAPGVSAALYNLTGQEVSEKHFNNLKPGFHKDELDTGKLPSGMYYLRLRSGIMETVKRVIVP